MRRDKVWVVAFDHFDDDESADETQNADQLDGSVDAGSHELLRGSCSRLENQCSLDLEKKGRDSEKLRRGLIRGVNVCLVAGSTHRMRSKEGEWLR